MNNSKPFPAFDIDILLPPPLKAFGPLVSDALKFFLSQLGPARLSEISAIQSALPQSAGPADRLVALFHVCPTLHKLAQVIARHRGLDPLVRQALTALETFPPITPLDEVRRIIDEDLTAQGVREDVRIADAALAEASVAIVVPVTWHRTPSGPPQKGVLKVLKPGVKDRLEEELNLLDALADHLEDVAPRYDVPALDHRTSFEHVRTLLLGEVHFAQEQKNLFAAGQQYAARRDVWIPRLLPFSTPRLTAMERIDGVRVTDATSLPAWKKRQFARTIVDAMIADVVFSRNEAMTFHADPHAGNLFAADDGRLAILDWSLTGRLHKRECETIARLLMAALLRDAAGLCTALDALAVKHADPIKLADVAARSLDELLRGRLIGPNWIVDLIDQSVLAGASFPANLLLFRKTLITLQGVVSDVCEDSSLDAIVMSKGMAEFWAELPRRACTWPLSTDFTTHVSSSQIANMMATAPFAVGQVWMRAWTDCLRTCLPTR
ncbi:MAG: hypothetical protein B6D36_07890 [Planctomycetes bacterium UTPLA1]|jgi:ubiquinone biosynthesis protein|nr:MAG: hypothetical protein B6D36_07890 [Planctomycetes bacterium UTPLA1]